MPLLTPLVPVAAGVGGTTTGGAIAGLTLAEVALVGTAVVGSLVVVDIIDDYLDTPASESELEKILAQAGVKSKEDSKTLRDCKVCDWCQINIQAQGNFLPLKKKTDPQGIGPYLVRRTVFVREGVIIAGATHAFAKGLSSRKNFKLIEKWGILEKTIEYIQRQPPSGLAPGGRDYRPGKLEQYTSEVRYDIGVFGTINAFLE